VARTRRFHLGESRLLAEYMAEQYTGATISFQPRVGSDPSLVGVDITDEGARRLARNLNRRPDAWAITATEIVIIEASMQWPTTKIGRLMEYLLLVPATPDLVPYLDHRVVGEILTAIHDPMAELLCRQHGFRYVWRRPSWLDEYLAAYPDRARKAPHSGFVQALAEAQEQR
jgi:hypothetical protein